MEMRDHIALLQQGLLENVNYKLHKYCVIEMQALHVIRIEVYSTLYVIIG